MSGNIERLAETRQQKRKRLGREQAALEGFGQPVDSTPHMARKFDPEACPLGYDPDIWSLSLLWDQIMSKYHHDGYYGLPVIYGHLEKTIKTSRLRDRHMGASKHDPDKRAWYWLLEQMITRWWDYEMDSDKPEFAINDFCTLAEFSYMEEQIKEDLDRERPRKTHPATTRVVDPEIRQRNIDKRKERIRRWEETGRTR